MRATYRCRASASPSPGDRNLVTGNSITGHVPSGEVPFSGGVVLVDASEGGADPPSDNTVTGNTFSGNQVDVFSDGTGQRNVVQRQRLHDGRPGRPLPLTVAIR